MGGEEGVVAEVTLPMLRQAVELPVGTLAAAEIISGVTNQLAHALLRTPETSVDAASVGCETVWRACAGHSRNRNYHTDRLRGPASFPA